MLIDDMLVLDYSRRLTSAQFLRRLQQITDGDTQPPPVQTQCRS